MPTYYVAPYGSNSNNGTTPATPWLTIQFALGAASGTNPGLVAGDTVWIAPGTYREVITYGGGNGTAGNTIKIYGDPTFTRSWTSGSVGRVRITNYVTNDTTLPTLGNTFQCVADYIDIQDISFDGAPTGSVTGNTVSEACVFLRGGNISVTRCAIQSTNNSRQVGIEWVCPTGKKTFTLDRCSVMAGFAVWCYSLSQTGPYDVDANIKSCFIMSGQDLGLVLEGAVANQIVGLKAYNNTIISNGTIGVYFHNPSVTSSTTTVLRNNLIYCTRGIGVQAASSITITQSNNFVMATTSYTNVSPTTNTITAPMFDIASSRIQQFSMFPWFSPLTGSPVIGAGSTTGAPSVDLYGNTWTSNPTVGGIESKTESDNPPYQPTERNASTITIAPGSTSQSIELYLGATGLTASTSGLSARYNRTRTASVSIPLVARTIAQAWTAGGFAEVDSTNMPGIYRLDLPDAALAAGADDVTVVVRGASGTNGAVMTIKLSSGGLTSAQTASAVWDASPAGYNTATTFGGVVNQIDTTATGIDSRVQDVPSLVWDEAQSGHTTAGTFGSYLDSKVSDAGAASRIQLRQGPFLIKQNAVDSVITEVNQFLSTVPNIEMVLIDSSGGSVSVAGATLVMRVRNQAGTAVVNNITPTVAYADGGVIRWSPNLSWTALGVTTAGTYRIVVERTMSGVTTTFGPFLVQLSSG